MISKNFALLIPAFIIRGFKEFGEPARKAQIMDFAPEGKKSLYFGAFYFYRDVIVTFGVKELSFLESHARNNNSLA